MGAFSPNTRLIGISTVHGNASVQQTTENATKILIAFNRDGKIPLHKGKDRPLFRDQFNAGYIHGETGLDGSDLLPILTDDKLDAIKMASHNNAILAMYNAIKSEPLNSVYLVVTGPMTNVGLLFALYPEIGLHIKQLVAMGGALGVGNVTYAFPTCFLFFFF